MTTVKAESYASAAARERHVPRGLANTHPIFIDRAEGTRVWDVDGKEYLDFTSGIGVLNTGHRHPRIVSAVQEQLGRLMHTCFQVTMYEPYVELVSRLCALAGEVDTHKGVLFTTGAEAIENAVKIARAHTRRTAVIAFSGGFHGRSLLALTMTASSPAYRQNFGPFKNVFSPKSHKADIAVNYGLAAVVYLLVGSLIAGMLVRMAPRGTVRSRTAAV